MKRSGIVTEVNNKYACILTSGGEFLKVKFKGTTPTIGQIYSGEIYSKPKFKMPLIAATLAFVLCSGGLLSYFTPAYAVTVEINPSVRLQVNMWNRIVKAEAMNDDGVTLLSNLNVTNMSINPGLEAIVTEAKKDNFITEEDTDTEKSIKVTLEGKSTTPSSIKHFTDTLKEEKINLQIIKDGTVIESISDNANSKNDNSESNKKDTEKADTNHEDKTDKNSKNEKDNNKDKDQVDDKKDKTDDKKNDKTDSQKEKTSNNNSYSSNNKSTSKNSKDGEKSNSNENKKN